MLLDFCGPQLGIPPPNGHISVYGGGDRRRRLSLYKLR